MPAFRPHSNTQQQQDEQKQPHNDANNKQNTWEAGSCPGSLRIASTSCGTRSTITMRNLSCGLSLVDERGLKSYICPCYLLRCSLSIYVSTRFGPNDSTLPATIQGIAMLARDDRW